jgi:hypothetical protein
MAISFKWSISKLRVIPQQSDKSNVVSVVEWLVQGTDDVNLVTASISGIRSFVLGDTFTLFEELTEQQVLDWCFAPEIVTWTDDENVEHSVTKNLKSDTEAQVTGQIERQLAKKIVEPNLPWAEVAQPA